jgi:hypothetical protein
MKMILGALLAPITWVTIPAALVLTLTQCTAQPHRGTPPRPPKSTKAVLILEMSGAHLLGQVSTSTTQLVLTTPRSAHTLADTHSTALSAVADTRTGASCRISLDSGQVLSEQVIPSTEQGIGVALCLWP